MTLLTNPFDRGDAEAVEYDAWYDSASGHAVLITELRCVRNLLAGAAHPWLDLGTGTGRFGGELGAGVGVDPAAAMLRLAAHRLPAAVRAVSEALPFRSESVGAVLSVAAIEFFTSLGAAFAEVARVLRPGGRFVAGFFPASGPWAGAYMAAGRDPTSVFHGAHFFAVEELAGMAAQAGLRPGAARSALFEPLEASPSRHVTDTADDTAGFVAMAFTKVAET